MNLLFVKRSYPESYSGGDRIYDEKLIRALEDQRIVTKVLDLDRQSTSKTIVAAAANLSLPTYYRYASRQNINLISAAAVGRDAVVLSHEALAYPFLAARLDRPCLFIMHNVLSLIEGRSGIRGAMKIRSHLLERRILSQPNITVGVLSAREKQLLEADTRTGRIVYLPPGTPTAFKTLPTRLIDDSLFIGGTVDWGPKRRDYNAFARYHSGSNLPPLRAESEIVDDGALRIAIITDRFSTGFKLKAPDLIRRNCVVVSLSSVKSDFPASAMPNESIIEIQRHEDLPMALRQVSDRLVKIREEIEELKAKFAVEVSWERTAATSLEALRSIV